MSGYTTLGLTVPISEILNPKLWRDRYAWGIPLAGAMKFTPSQQLNEATCALQDCAGNETIQATVEQIPDDVIRWHLRAALSELEMRLGVTMGIVRVLSPEIDSNERLGSTFDRVGIRLPYKRQDAQNWYHIQLDRSVISVERIRGYYFGQKVIEASVGNNNIGNVVAQWKRQGDVYILPVNIGALIVNSGYSPQPYAQSVWELIWSAPSVPDFWAVDYTLGPVDNMTGTPGLIEAVLAHWVYLRAGKLIINMAGTAFGQGITSTSISANGFSRSITTSQSAMYGINSAMELVFQSYTDSIDWERLRRQKVGLRVYSMSR